MEASSSTDLPESIFFTARKARIRSNTQDSSQPASLSGRKYYSARIESIMKRKREASLSREEAEIEASKDHWTVVEPDYLTAAATRLGSGLTTSSGSSKSEASMESERDSSLYEENVKEIQRLQEANPESGFFRIGDDGLVLGRKIGEGGQAEIYDAGFAIVGDRRRPFILKAFKAGFSVTALQSQWPLALLHKMAPVNKHRSMDGGFNPVMHGRLLKDGRFAFQMFRFWGDLRKLLDVRMEHNGNRCPPFMMPDGNYHECCMASIIASIVGALRALHKEGVLHRDLKASNVLIDSSRVWIEDRGNRFDPIELKHDILPL